ncbi:MAG TPA: hypothetical protein VJG30_01690 [Candidatus Nanoarchaeia archaeon]|nr:hypothetical protein [Candidatus Nanoarchaeia archaeon]
MKDYTNIYTAIFWISLVSILIWLILKALGYINTPPLIELMPFFSAVFGAGAFFQMIRDIKNRVINVESEIKDVKMTVHSLDKRVTVLESKV